MTRHLAITYYGSASHRKVFMEPRSTSFVHSGASVRAPEIGTAGSGSKRQEEERRGRRLLEALTREAQSLVARLRPGNPDVAPREAEPPPKAMSGPVTLKGSADGIRLMIRLRNARASVFGEADLFHDPAWDILLDLYAAELEGRTVPLTSASIASMVPPSTAARWITLLETRDLVRRRNVDHETRWPNLELTEKARDAIERFLDAVDAGMTQLSVRG